MVASLVELCETGDFSSELGDCRGDSPDDPGVVVAVDVKVHMLHDAMRNIDLLDDLNAEPLQGVEGFEHPVVALIGTIEAQDAGEVPCESSERAAN